MLKYLNSKSVLMLENVEGKVEIITKIINAMSNKPSKILNKDSFFEKVMKREDIGTTGIGRGIAIPHARCENVEDVTLGIAIVKRGVDFCSPDGDFVKIVILVGAPKEKNSEYLVLLSSITKAFRNRDLRENILNSEDKEEVFEHLVAFFQDLK